MRRHAISVSLVRPLAQGLERIGAPSSALTDALGVRDLDDNDFVPADALDDAIDGLLRRAGDPSLLLTVARTAPPGALGFLDYCAAASVDVRQAIERLARFYGLLTNRAEIVLEIRGDDARVVQRYATTSPGRRYLTELAFAVITVRVRQLGGDAFRLRRLRFMHERIAGDDAYEGVFGLAPEFSAPSDEMIFDRAHLDLPFRTADPLVAKLLEEHATKLAATKRTEDPFEERLRGAIVESLEHGAEMTKCADALRVAPRTLQRRLRDRDTSFSKVVDDVRRELAVGLLRDAMAPVTEIAFRTGFRDVSAFHRAFRRWTGKTPQQFRSNTLS